MNRIKYPLNLYIVSHPDATFAPIVAEDLYTNFCRDYKKPLSRGMGIPVYFRNSKMEDGKPVAINPLEAEKNAIILLIDKAYYLDESYIEYTEDLVKLVDSNTRIFPVSLFNDAYSVGCGLSDLQFIRGHELKGETLDLKTTKDQDLSIRKIRTEVLHDCARLLMDFQPSYQDDDRDRVGSPVKLFLSHAKIDGEEISLRFKRFIEDNLKLDVFFDTVDIANGYSFSKQFETQIRHSGLVVFHTDAYSSREWCRREVLIAKKHKSPIVVFHHIKEGEKRAFPYLGNMPTTTMLENEWFSFYRIVNLTLFQVLNNLYQLKLLSSIRDIAGNADTEYTILSSPPELLNFLEFPKNKPEGNKRVVLYPDPPLGIEELSVLNEFDREIEFVTPINF